MNGVLAVVPPGIPKAPEPAMVETFGNDCARAGIGIAIPDATTNANSIRKIML
jgi:hypothetical protein